MRKIADQIGFTGTISQIKDECGRRFCKAYGITRKNAYMNVNCPHDPVDMIYAGCKESWPPYHFGMNAIGHWFQLRTFIGGSKHLVSMEYSSGCLDPGDNYLFTVVEWNDYNY